MRLHLKWLNFLICQLYNFKPINNVKHWTLRMDIVCLSHGYKFVPYLRLKFDELFVSLVIIILQSLSPFVLSFTSSSSSSSASIRYYIFLQPSTHFPHFIVVYALCDFLFLRDFLFRFFFTWNIEKFHVSRIFNITAFKRNILEFVLFSVYAICNQCLFFDISLRIVSLSRFIFPFS